MQQTERKQYKILKIDVLGKKSEKKILPGLELE